MRSCDECNLYCNIGQGVILMNSTKQKKTFCKDCYNKLSKEQKKQYIYVEGRIDSDHVWAGVMLGMMGGGLAGAAAVAASEINPPTQIQEHNGQQELRTCTEQDMNNFSIDFFGRHHRLLDKGRYQAVIDYFEGKTNTRNYRKYIEKA